MWRLALNGIACMFVLLAVAIEASDEASAQGKFTGVVERVKYSSNVGVPSRYLRGSVTYRKVRNTYQAKLGSLGYFAMTPRSGVLYGVSRVLRLRSGCTIQAALASDPPNRAKLRACLKFVAVCGSYYQDATYCGYLRRRQ